MDVRLSQQLDQVHWKLAKNGVFSVKSMYLDLINSVPIPRSVNIWKVKVPLRIKVLMWFVHKQVILTKDNLVKRNWAGSRRCSYCD
uniref:Reverse transcriptase zinc-binding domain-containing protein n=1 Tax=Aegilops tauschii subsp. strangulata TaxID=200361 RepID=A0A452XBH2_AEGTS